jgi:hypothetical protein
MCRHPKKLGLPKVPAVTISDLDVTISDLDEAKLQMLRLAFNRLSEVPWDLEALRLEFSDIMEISGEIDFHIRTRREIADDDLRDAWRSFARNDPFWR